jgi:hypothetical protein
MEMPPFELNKACGALEVCNSSPCGGGVLESFDLANLVSLFIVG